MKILKALITLLFSTTNLSYAVTPMIATQVAAIATCNPNEKLKTLQHSTTNNGGDHLQNNNQDLCPTRNQDDIGYCYAYAGADLLEHWMKKKQMIDSSQCVSAMSLSLNFDKDNWSKTTASYQARALNREDRGNEIDEYKKEYSGLLTNLLNATREKNKIFKQLSEGNKESKETSEKLISSIDSLRKVNKKVDKFLQKNGIHLNDLTRSLHRKKHPELDKLLKEQEEIKKQQEQLFSKQEEIIAEINQNPLMIAAQRKIEEIREEMDHLENLENVNLNQEVEIPEGGHAKGALESMLPNFCLESEVNSRDEKLREIYDQFSSLLQNTPERPSVFKEALHYLNYQRFSSSQEHICLTLDIVREIFPNSNFFNANDLITFFHDLKPYENLFTALIERSCKQPQLSLTPEIQKLSSSYDLPILDNKNLIDEIDRAIESGEVASIAYRGQVLTTPPIPSFNNSVKDNHASIITGKAKICGQDYYVLRNSWGKKGCQSHQSSFLHSSHYSKPVHIAMARDIEDICSAEGEEYVEKYYYRKKSIFNFKENKNTFCRSNNSKKKCVEEGNILNEQIKSSCKRRRDDYLHRKSKNLPYLCDKDGNFIIKKDYLKKSIYNVTTIKN